LPKPSASGSPTGQGHSTRNEPASGERVVVSAVDPVNLTGTVLPGPRVPAYSGRSLVLIDGVPEEEAKAAEAFAGADRR